MRKVAGSLEDKLFLSAALLSLLAPAAFLLRPHLSPRNDRIRYGEEHLPAALLAIFLFTALAGLARPLLARASHLKNQPTPYFLAAIVAVFALFWLPVWLAGGFVQDDWLLLAAASVRQIVTLHPADSWFALDSVDGNFRPLGTVLYFGYLLKWFGPAARVFTFGPFLLTLLATLVAFAIVRELGYARPAAAAASVLFLSRGVLYTIVAWTSALGDGIAILCCGLTALLVLKANRRAGLAALGYHLLGWLFFCIAILGKQSAFAAPLIVALLLLLRPGEHPAPALPRRALTATVALLAYSATAAIVFFHAKALRHARNPYPIRFSIQALLQSFAHATWYFVVLKFPERDRLANLLSSFFGLAIVAAVLFLARRFPGLLGDRPRDLVFAGLAAAASVSLFVLLETRAAPYYGCMSAFWISIALGIALTRPGAPGGPAARLDCFLLLVVAGFANIRLEQTSLLPTGGYLFGAFGMDTERRIQANLQRQLAAPGDNDVLLLADCIYINPYSSMALLDAPTIPRILLLNRGTYTANDRQGLRPADDFAGLTDPEAYHWTEPLDAATAVRMLAQSRVLRLRCRDGKIEPAPPEAPSP